MNECLECGKLTENKKFCSLSCSCSYNGRIKHKEAVKKYYNNPNYCLNCKKIIHVSDKERVADAKAKKFCSQSCSASYNNIGKKKKKYCKYCKKEIVERNSKKYCSQKCWQNSIRDKKIEKWLSGKWSGTVKDGLSSTIRKYLLKQSKYKCSKCRWGEINPITGKIPLSVHHIDGNYKNNRPENLIVLCPNCHSLTETYGSLNSGNGREYRYN